MKKMMQSAALILVVAMAGGAALAQNRGSGPGTGQPPANGQKAGAPQEGRGPGGVLMHCLSILDLTEDQKTQIKSIHEAARPAAEALHELMKTDRQALRGLLDADVPDACAVGTATLKIESDRDALKTHRDSVRASVEAVLTSEQKIKLSGCIEGAKGRRGGRGGQ